jgi:hypothetical protein
MHRWCIPVLSLFVLLFLGGCSTPRYEYRYVRGKTAVLRHGVAQAPPKAPRAVHAAIAAGNRIAGSPYRYGGGHGQVQERGYDCSGAASYVLREAGLLGGTCTSDAFRYFGNSGEGKWITVYAKKGHVFLSVAGLRFDTGWTQQREGPRWTTQSRPAEGVTLRHPPGL